MTRIEEINVEMLKEFKLHGIEDTPENRYSFLQGLRDGWNEDPEMSIEKSLYLIALTLEMTRIRIRVTLNK